MKKLLAIIIPLAIIILSCNEAKPKFYQVEIIYDQPFTTTRKYPDFFSKFFIPDNYTEDSFLVPKPIKIKRVDRENCLVDISLFGFEKIGEPTYNLYYDWMLSYFKDSMPSNALFVPNGNLKSCNKWIEENLDKTIIVIAKIIKKSYRNTESLYYFEDESEAKSKLIELVKSNCCKKIYLVYLNDENQMTQPEQSLDLHDSIKNYILGLNGQISRSNSWHDLFIKSAEFILTEREHKFDHPSAYIYVISAAVLAIKTSSTQDMYNEMVAIRPNNNLNKNICKLKTKEHLQIWNKVISGLLNKDTTKLIVLKESLFSRWDNYLDGNIPIESNMDLNNIVPPKLDLCSLSKSSCNSTEFSINNLPDGYYDIDIGENNDLHSYSNLESRYGKLKARFQKSYTVAPIFKISKIIDKTNGKVYYCFD